MPLPSPTETPCRYCGLPLRCEYVRETRPGEFLYRFQACETRYYDAGTDNVHACDHRLLTRPQRVTRAPVVAERRPEPQSPSIPPVQQAPPVQRQYTGELE